MCANHAYRLGRPRLRPRLHLGRSRAISGERDAPRARARLSRAVRLAQPSRGEQRVCVVEQPRVRLGHAAEVRPRCGRGAAEVRPKCGRSVAEVQPRGGRSVAEGRPRGGRGAAEVRPRCGRGAAEVRPRCGRGAAEVRPKCGRGAAEGRPRCGRGAAEIIPRAWIMRVVGASPAGGSLIMPAGRRREGSSRGTEIWGDMARYGYTRPQVHVMEIWGDALEERPPWPGEPSSAPTSETGSAKAGCALMRTYPSSLRHTCATCVAKLRSACWCCLSPRSSQQSPPTVAASRCGSAVAAACAAAAAARGAPAPRRPARAHPAPPRSAGSKPAAPRAPVASRGHVPGTRPWDTSLGHVPGTRPWDTSLGHVLRSRQQTPRSRPARSLSSRRHLGDLSATSRRHLGRPPRGPPTATAPSP